MDRNNVEGKISLNNRTELVVSGLKEDIPENSSVIYQYH